MKKNLKRSNSVSDLKSRIDFLKEELSSISNTTHALLDKSVINEIGLDILLEDFDVASSHISAKLKNRKPTKTIGELYNEEIKDILFDVHDEIKLQIEKNIFKLRKEIYSSDYTMDIEPGDSLILILKKLLPQTITDWKKNNPTKVKINKSEIARMIAERINFKRDIEYIRNVITKNKLL